jgi:diadenosine tetraphosphatase ApaH/serine/threonine PP2A family protein phosphatase
MQKDDLVFTGHMLDTARKAVSKVAGKTHDLLWALKVAASSRSAGQGHRKNREC